MATPADRMHMAPGLGARSSNQQREFPGRSFAYTYARVYTEFVQKHTLFFIFSSSAHTERGEWAELEKMKKGCVFGQIPYTLRRNVSGARRLRGYCRAPPSPSPGPWRARRLDSVDVDSCVWLATTRTYIAFAVPFMV